MSSKRLKVADQSSQSQDKSLVLRSAEFTNKSSVNKRDDKTYIPPKIVHSSSKKSLKGNRSLGHFKPLAALKEPAKKEATKKNEYKTKIECDLRMPGKRAQCIRKVKAVFSEIIDTVHSSD